MPMDISSPLARAGQHVPSLGAQDTSSAHLWLRTPPVHGQPDPGPQVSFFLSSPKRGVNQGPGLPSPGSSASHRHQAPPYLVRSRSEPSTSQGLDRLHSIYSRHLRPPPQPGPYNCAQGWAYSITAHLSPCPSFQLLGPAPSGPAPSTRARLCWAPDRPPEALRESGTRQQVLQCCLTSRQGRGHRLAPALAPSNGPRRLQPLPRSSTTQGLIVFAPSLDQ
ncbi:hypothetical protein NDU88_000515 [Pleurodeles waltl]|uniref:Uncharacterized protein n=1 Tax=Pleurodeles waltl TaxID=8319 RepID=A0AAV7NCE8_PLEWA|nr:hypothetical protein NDU88_000515 [Pleurodeles waltl]